MAVEPWVGIIAGPFDAAATAAAITAGGGGGGGGLAPTTMGC